MKKKVIAVLLATAMCASLFAACGAKKEEAAPAAESTSAAAEETTEEAAEETTEEAAAPADGEKIENYHDWLVEHNDNLSLSGIQASVQEDRADVYKALDKVEKKDDVTIGWAGASLGSTFFTAWMDYSHALAEKYGYKMVESNCQFDTEKQNTQIDSFIQQGVDVIMLNAVDVPSQATKIQDCIDAGIPVVVATNTFGTTKDPFITNIISSANENGFLAGEYACEQLYDGKTPVKVGMTVSDLSNGDSNSRMCGFISGFVMKSSEIQGKPITDKYEAIYYGFNIWQELKNSGSYDASAEWGLDIVGYGKGGGTDAASGQTAASDLLTAHPDMDVIAIEEDSQAGGVIAECKQHDLVPGEDIKLACCADGTISVCDMIKDGSVMCSSINSPEYYANAIFQVLNVLFGKEENPDLDLNNLIPNQNLPTELITPENVDDYYVEGADFAPVKAESVLYTVPQWNEKNAAEAAAAE